METVSMFTTTLGTASVIGAIAMVFYSSKKRAELHKNNKMLHRIIVGILFGLLSIYASVSAVEFDGALCNCRNLAPLYAGLVGGPIPGIIAALIGGLFRYFVYGGDTALACMLACFVAGILGSIVHYIVEKDVRYTIPVGVCTMLLSEIIHMLILCAFGFAELAQKIALPIITACVLGMAFCLYMYRRCHQDK